MWWCFKADINLYRLKTVKWPYILIKYFYGNIQWDDFLSRAESSPSQRSPTSRTSWTTSDLRTTGWRPLVQMTFLLLVVGCISPSPIWAVDFAVESASLPLRLGNKSSPFDGGIACWCGSSKGSEWCSLYLVKCILLEKHMGQKYKCPFPTAGPDTVNSVSMPWRDTVWQLPKPAWLGRLQITLGNEAFAPRRGQMPGKASENLCLALGKLTTGSSWSIPLKHRCLRYRCLKQNLTDGNCFLVLIAPIPKGAPLHSYCLLPLYLFERAELHFLFLPTPLISKPCLCSSYRRHEYLVF